MKRLVAVMMLLSATAAWGDEQQQQQRQMKFNYAESLLTSSASAKRVEASTNDAAKEKLAQAREKLKEARSAEKKGKAQQAGELLDEALRLAAAAAQLVPDAASSQAQQRTRYEELLRQVKGHREWHVEFKGVDPHEKEDERKMVEEIARAEQMAGRGEYSQAAELLNNILGILLTKTNVAIGSKTITYDLNFSSTAEEFRYELESNREYERLVPIAMTQKSADTAVRKLVDDTVSKALQLRADAEKSFSGGNVEEALGLIRESTGKFQAALRIAGVR